MEVALGLGAEQRPPGELWGRERSSPGSLGGLGRLWCHNRGILGGLGRGKQDKGAAVASGNVGGLDHSLHPSQLP